MERGVDEGLVQLLEIAASNPDLIHFQKMLNTWIKNLCHSEAAFLIFCRETGMCNCQIFGEWRLDRPISMGSVEDFSNLFGESEGICHQTSLPQEMNEKVLSLKKTGFLLAGEAECREEAILFPIRSKLGIVAFLCLFPLDPQSLEECVNSIGSQLRVISALFAIVLNVEQQRRLAEQSEVFLSMAQNVFSSLEDMSLLVRNITKEAKTLIEAETCSLFLLDKEHSELVAEVFEKNGMNDEYLTEIRLPMESGIAGHVAKTGLLMNVEDAYSHPLFYKNVDDRTGFHTKNILCFPIKNSCGDIVGVAELCNKIGRPCFTEHDEQIASTFSIYCAISISHCLLYRRLQEAHRRTHLASELMVYDSHLQVVKVAEEDILRLSLGVIPPPASFGANFCSFDFAPRSVGPDRQLQACLTMFQDLGLLERWRMRRRTLAHFLVMVQKGYRDVPYHNWSHAFAVCHFCYLLLKLPSVQEKLTELERLSLLVASLCHDIDHRGTNNAFQVQSKTPLAQLYSSEGSVLERHHFAQSVCILNMDDCNIVEYLPAKEYNEMLDCIRDIILATDVAQHLRKVGKMREMIKKGYDKTKKDHRYLLLCLLMTACDLSDQTKPWEASKRIAANIYKEFFSQGDLEKAMGNCPSEMMDRERACIPKLQLDFLDTVALPVYEMLGQLFPECRSVHESLLEGRRCWTGMDELLSASASPGSLDILKDSELEEEVVRRVLGRGTPDVVRLPSRVSGAKDSRNSGRGRCWALC